jgi:hypothetical protein
MEFDKIQYKNSKLKIDFGRYFFKTQPVLDKAEVKRRNYPQSKAHFGHQR